MKGESSLGQRGEGGKRLTNKYGVEEGTNFVQDRQ